MPNQLLPLANIIISLKPIKFLQQIIHILSNSNKHIICFLILALNTSRQKNILRHQLNQLLITLQFLPIFIFFITHLSQLFRRSPYLFRLKMSQGHFSNIIPNRPIFINIQSMLRSQKSLRQILTSMINTARPSNTFQQRHFITTNTNFLLSQIKMFFNIYLPLNIFLTFILNFFTLFSTNFTFSIDPI